MAVPPSKERADPLSIAHLQNDLNRVSARGGVFTILSQVGVFFIQTVTMIGLARLLQPSDFGLFTMVTAVTGFILLFKDLGLSNATIQKAEITQPEVSLLFWINVAVSIFLSLVVLGLAPVLAWFYHEPRLFGIVATLSTGIFAGGFAVQHQAILNRQMRFKAIAVSDNLSMLTSSLSGVIFALCGFGYWSLVFMQVIFFAANSVILWCLSGWNPSRPAWHANAPSLIAFGSHLTGGTMMNYLSRNLDSFLIGRVWGPISLGYYGRAYQLLMLPVLQINLPFKAVAVPALSRLADQPEKYREMGRTVLGNMARVSMPGIAFMIVTSDWLVNVILGPKWVPSALIFVCLGGATLFQPISTSTVWVMLSQGRSREVLTSQFFSALATLAAIVAGLHWGAVGVAAAISIVEIVVRTPYLFSVVGRSGPLRTRDMYDSVFAGLGGTLAVALTVGIIRHFFVFTSSIEGLAVTALPACLAAFVCTYLMPGGRDALRQLIWFVDSVRHKSPKAPEPVS